MGLIRQVLKKDTYVSSYILPVLLILSMFAVVISVGLHQLSESEEHIHKEALSNLNLNAQVVSQQLNDLYVSLESVAPTLAFENGLTREQMLRSMTFLRKACGFDFVVRTNTDGIAFNYLGKDNINISNRKYIHEAIKGHRASEYVTAGTYDPSSAYLILAVPIFYQGQVVGVLHGSYKVSNFDALLSKLADNGRSYSSGTFILAADRRLIASSNRNEDSRSFVQAFLQEGEISSNAGAAIADNLKLGRSGYLSLNVNGQEQYAYYTPFTEMESCFC